MNDQFGTNSYVMVRNCNIMVRNGECMVRNDYSLVRNGNTIYVTKWLWYEMTVYRSLNRPITQ